MLRLSDEHDSLQVWHDEEWSAKHTHTHTLGIISSQSDEATPSYPRLHSRITFQSRKEEKKIAATKPIAMHAALAIFFANTHRMRLLL